MILAAGAFGSPQLLLLSGIGPAEQLRALGIDVEVDARGVGENLQDHPFITVVCEVEADSLVDAEHPRYLAEWLLRRSGPLTSTVAEAFAFVRTRPGLPAPDVQYHFAPAYFVDHGAEEFDGHALTLGPVLITPKSRGRLTLRSADPSDEAADRHQLARRARGRRRDARGHADRARDHRQPSRCARSSSARSSPGRTARRPRGRPAPPRRAALPPGRDLPDGDRRRRGRRRAAAGARRRGAARGRRVDHAADHRAATPTRR